MTIRLPDDLKQRLNDHPEINWSEVARQSMQQYLTRIELADELASGSQLTEKEADELGERLKHEIAAHCDDEEQ
jgi:predicted transcriptional regulator